MLLSPDMVILSFKFPVGNGINTLDKHETAESRYEVTDQIHNRAGGIIVCRYLVCLPTYHGIGLIPWRQSDRGYGRQIDVNTHRVNGMMK